MADQIRNNFETSEKVLPGAFSGFAPVYNPT